ncbi:MAG: hypothetical protein ACM3QS_15370 [Bacteroidota bacterium]
MDQALLWTAALLTGLYGALTAFAGVGQLGAGKIQRWAALGLVFFGMLVIASAVLAWMRSGSTFWLLILGLLGIHAVAINNGLKMYGRIDLSHHLARLLISAVLLLLTWLGLR